MTTLQNIKHELDELCRGAVKHGHPDILIPVEWYALVSVAIARVVSEEDRVTDLLNANNQLVTENRSARALVTELRGRLERAVVAAERLSEGVVDRQRRIQELEGHIDLAGAASFRTEQETLLSAAASLG